VAGIFGFIGNSGQKNLLNKMALALAARGKLTSLSSGSNFHCGTIKHENESTAALVSDSNGRITAACEGEIYNLGELTKLTGSDDRIHHNSFGFDIIPNLYLKYGKDFATHINGIFSIALWDKQEKTLMLVRDHLGSRSLYFTRPLDFFLFSSSINAFWATDLISKEIELSSIDKYLASLALSAPHTLFKNVFAVRPGHALIIKGRDVKEYAYWPIHKITEKRSVSEQDWVLELRDLFQDAVRIRSNSNDKIGVLVSGGVDTSSITATLAHFGKDLLGLSIAFEEKQFSDAPLQQIIYSKFNVVPNQIVMGPDRFVDFLISGVSNLDSPVNDVALAGMLCAFNAAADANCKVVFEGEGSDEIFCTSHSFGEFYISKYLFLPSNIRTLLLGWLKHYYTEYNSWDAKIIRMLARIGMKDFERRSTWIPGFSIRTRKKLLGVSFPTNQTWDVARDYYSHTRLRDNINIYQYGLTRLFLPDDLLFKNERMASAAGVINRTPFIDYRLVEKAFEIPAKFKLTNPTPDNDGTKLIFKKAMRGIVPDEILQRKKTRGFSQPTAVWYRNDLREFVHDTLLASNARIYNWLDKNIVKSICDDFYSDRLTSDYFINSLLILELWMQAHLH